MWVESRIVCFLPRFLMRVAHLPDLVGVQADGGFVEDEQVGVADECLRQADALAVALREIADQLALHFA